MTPDERTAREIVEAWERQCDSPAWSWDADATVADDALVGLVAAALQAEREACCRAICWSCAWTPGTPGAIRHLEAAHMTADGWQHRYRYAPTEPDYLTGCDASAIRDRGVPD